MLIDPAAELFTVECTAPGGASSAKLRIEYFVLDGANIVDADSVFVDIGAYDAGDTYPGETQPLPSIASGQRFRITRIFVYSQADSQTVAFAVRDAGTPATQLGAFGRAVLATNEVLIYNGGDFTVYAPAGDVRVPA